MSNLIKHAEYELRRAGFFDDDSDYNGALGDAVMELITVFSNQDHSGASAHRVCDLFASLALFGNLGPITNDAREWNDVADGVWQSRRNPSLFSNDGGITYYSIDEPERSLYTSTPCKS